MGGSSSTASVCGQWRYDAYGAATAAEHLYAFPAIRCGHKALFFDRLDSASADSLGNEPPRLIPFAHLVVQMRNRAYMPQLGRFLQPDPNATALTLIEATSYHGRGMGALVAAFDVQSLYGDGMNLYEYLGSNPWMRADPLGLEWEESYEGVFLRVASIADALLPIPILEPILQLLDGYRLMIAVAGFVQSAAYNAEDELNWALDWDASDDDNPRFGSYGGFNDQVAATDLLMRLEAGGTNVGPVMARTSRGGGSPISPFQVAFGKKVQSFAESKLGLTHAKRFIADGKVTTGKGRSRKTEHVKGARHLDGFQKSSNTYMEIKGGNQSLTERVRRQALKDAAIMRDEGVKIKWIFYTRKNKHTVSPELKSLLDDLGIQYSEKRLPNDF